MKTLTIELDNDLERQIESRSREEGREEAVVIVEALRHGLSEKQRREEVVKALEAVFAKPVPAPFATMTEEEVMQAVEEEITAQRAENRSAQEG
jgi:predicted transcriptional regulator